MTARRSHKYTQCAAKDCYRAPGRFSYYCTMHRQRYFTTGSQRGRLIRKHELAPFIKEIAPVLDRYLDHPSVVAAIDHIDDLLQGRGQSSREELAVLLKIRDSGATPKDALLVLLAVWGITNHHRLDDGEALSANLGNSFMLLVPRTRVGRMPSGRVLYKRANPSVYKPFGRRLREALGPLLARLWDIHGADEQRYVDQRFLLAPARVADLGSDVLGRGDGDGDGDGGE